MSDTGRMSLMSGLEKPDLSQANLGTRIAWTQYDLAMIQAHISELEAEQKLLKALLNLYQDQQDEGSL